MGVLTSLAGVVELNVIVQSIATMVGFGVGVDYSLIMIRRFIDEVSSLERGTALINTMRTAGRTVAASGTTVAAALVTLLIVELPVVRSMAIAAIVVVVVAILICIVVLPALLYLLGPRVMAWRVPWLPPTRERARRRWGTLARFTMARPIAALAITSAALIALTVPAFGLQTFSGDRHDAAEEFVGARGLRSGRGAVRQRCHRADTGRYRSRQYRSPAQTISPA